MHVGAVPSEVVGARHAERDKQLPAADLHPHRLSVLHAWRRDTTTVRSLLSVICTVLHVWRGDTTTVRSLLSVICTSSTSGEGTQPQSDPCCQSPVRPPRLETRHNYSQIPAVSHLYCTVLHTWAVDTTRLPSAPSHTPLNCAPVTRNPPAIESAVPAPLTCRHRHTDGLALDGAALAVALDTLVRDVHPGALAQTTRRTHHERTWNRKRDIAVTEWHW